MIKILLAVSLAGGFCVFLCAAEVICLTICRLIPTLRKRLEREMQRSPFCVAEAKRQEKEIEQYEIYREKSEAD